MALAPENADGLREQPADPNEDSDSEAGVEGSRRNPVKLVLRHLHSRDAEFQDLSRAFEADPTNVPVALKLARLYAGRGRPTRAGEVLNACRASAGLERNLLRDGGRLYFEIGDFGRAARWYGRAIAVDANPDEALIQANELTIDAAVEDALQGAGPDNKRDYLKAVELLLRERPGIAESRFAALTRAVPNYAPAWLGWRGALEVLGRADDAKAMGSAWVAASPKSAAIIPSAMARRLSARGLVFDPHEPVRVRPKGESLARAFSGEALRAGGDSLLQLPKGPPSQELDPVIPLAAAGEQKTHFSFRTAPRFVVSIEGAALVGRGLVLNLEGETPEELSPPSHWGKAGFRRFGDHLVADPALFMGGLYPVRTFDTPALLLTAPTDASFGDWILNFPPRLALAAAAGLDCPIVVRMGTRPAWIEMLVSLGVDPKRIIFHHPAGVSLFPRLFAPSWPLPKRGQPMTDLFGIYHELAQARGAGAAPTQRLYLSREGVSGRRLANEAQVRAAFERRGFRTVRPEQLGLKSAQALFASAAVVAGPYGSAFLNVVHSPVAPAALVLMPPESLSPPESTGFLDEVALWLGGNGARFGYLFGDLVPAVSGEASWTMPIDKVEAALDELLAGLGQA